MPWPSDVSTLGGLIRATIIGRLHGQATNNVLWFVRPGELGTPDWPAILQQIGTVLLDCAIAHLLPGLSSEFTLDGVRVTRMDSEAKEEVQVSAPANSVGALAESLPSTVAAVVTIRTAYAGKSNRGRIFIPGIPEANQAGSIVSGVPLTQIALFVACVLEKFRHPTGTEEARWVIFSRKAGYTPPNTYVGDTTTTSPVNNAFARSVLGTMRSRKLGVGA